MLVYIFVYAAWNNMILVVNTILKEHFFIIKQN